MYIPSAVPLTAVMVTTTFIISSAYTGLIQTDTVAPSAPIYLENSNSTGVLVAKEDTYSIHNYHVTQFCKTAFVVCGSE